MTDIAEVISSLRQFLISNLTITDEEIILGYPDDRIADDAEQKKIKVYVAIAGFVPEPSDRFPGGSETVVKDLQNETATISQLPNPYRVAIQIGSRERLIKDSWNRGIEIEQLIASEPDFTVGTDVYQIRPEIGDNQDDLTSEGFTRINRFSFVIWLDDIKASLDIPLVTSMLLNVNANSITIES